MVSVNDIVITGLGCVTPIGIGREAFWSNLRAGNSGIRLIQALNDSAKTHFYGASIPGFEGKLYVKPRKALKVMSREVQLAYASAHLAWEDSGLVDTTVEPDRTGVVFGSEMITGDFTELLPAIAACSESGGMDYDLWGPTFAKHIYPLWMLKNLPNMPACHVGIAIDARGPNNSIAQEEASGLLAIYEACNIIERGVTDLMVVGALGARVSATRMMFRPPSIYRSSEAAEIALSDDGNAKTPAACVPFDLQRAGVVPGEAAVTLVLERRSHAVKRNAKILGTIESCVSRYGAPGSRFSGSQQAIVAAGKTALEQAGIEAKDLSHVSAQGYSEQTLDKSEAGAIQSLAPETPVSAYSSYFGTAGAASGMLELAASLMASHHGLVLPTLNHKHTDPDCPVRVATEVETTSKQHFLKLSFTPHGHAAAIVIRAADSNA